MGAPVWQSCLNSAASARTGLVAASFLPGV